MLMRKETVPLDSRLSHAGQFDIAGMVRHFDEQEWLFHRCVVGIVEESADWIHLAVFADASLNARIELAGAGSKRSAVRVADGSHLFQIHHFGKRKTSLIENVKNKAQVLGPDLSALLRGGNHRLQGVLGGRGWSRGIPEETDMVIEKADQPRSVGMLDRNYDVSVAHKVLDLGSVGEGGGRVAMREQNDRKFPTFLYRWG